MKITMPLLMLLVLLLPNTYPQDYTQWNLPESAIVRLGKGSVIKVLYSPDGSRLAIQSSIGIWFYDATTYREVALLNGYMKWDSSIAFSPDGKILASGNMDGSVRLWGIPNSGVRNGRADCKPKNT